MTVYPLVSCPLVMLLLTYLNNHSCPYLSKHSAVFTILSGSWKFEMTGCRAKGRFSEYIALSPNEDVVLPTHARLFSKSPLML